MQDKDLLTAWKSQLRKGAAELAVLAYLRRHEAYGLEILNALSRGSSFEVSEGSIYPLLKRLEKADKIISRWVEAEDGGARRKYYRLSPDGERLLELMRAEWQSFRRDLTDMVEGGGS
ncbi:PadR family transcriptional regulator [Hyphobacterium sp.]|uniref:PadR family transcriptional regulator n=1 Tax=Hyphobacterium sp. TaxID=2004662 RepID=UPI0037489D00